MAARDSNNFGQFLAELRMDEAQATGKQYALALPADDAQEWDYMGVPEPHELQAIYERGFRGVGVKPELPMDFGAMPTFYQLFPWAKGIGKGKICLPYLAILAFEPEYGTYEPQTRGSCVSHGTRNGGMGDYCADAMMGETQYKGRLATENIYAARGHTGCGADCGTLAHYVSKNGRGGFLVRGKYGDVDLTTFSSSTESWAARYGRSGAPAHIEDVASQNKALSVFRCASPDEERDAHALGFGTNGCSGLGFSSATDEYGLAERTTWWSHSMARMGTVDTPWAHQKYSGSIRCTIQSWGKWNRQKGMPEGVKAMPGGSFFVREKLFSSFDIYGFADVVGFGRSYGDYCDYLVERAKKLQDFTTRCYDEGSVPSLAS